ncbi:MAG TPA: GTP cyclohydrolase I [Vicinamibacteria bacterium]|nr:GTP cyclohydrolase I [Vicinamibacteria bacterium]
MANPGNRFDLEAMQDAVRRFLEASGHVIEGTELEPTPALVARAWSETFLDGYEVDPKELFQEAYPLPKSRAPSGMVLLKAIPFHGLCPHHLLPYHGLAHLAYLPGPKLASLSSLTRLVDCYSHRLEIQETVTRQIADALVAHLRARGAAVLLETDQTCMTMRNAERRGTRTVTQHFSGSFGRRINLRLEFLRSLGSLP